jgi:hypothetical protein
MAKFFEKLNSSGGQQLQILSDHPNPGNREIAIQAEMKTLPTRQYGSGTGQFARMQKEVAALPAPSKKPQAAAIAPGSTVPAPGSTVPAPGSTNPGDWQEYQGQGFSIRYPAGWKAFGENQSSAITLAPRDGIVSQGNSSQIGFGAAIDLFTPKSGRANLRNATSDLVKKLQGENPQMTVSAGSQAATVAGLSGVVTTLHANSPFGGGEVDTLFSVMRQQKLWYVVFIAPEKDQPRVEASFTQMLESVRFPQ